MKLLYSALKYIKHKRAKLNELIGKFTILQGN